MHDTSTSRRDLHRVLTDQIIATIESNPGQFTLPWRQGGGLDLPTNAFSGRRYTGINILGLWCAALRCGFSQPLWATYAQWSQLRAQVRKGERANLVVFYKSYQREPDPAAVDDDGRRRVARAFPVFNVAQVEGFVPPPQPEPGAPIDRIAAADAFVAATNASISYGGNRAFYLPSADRIQMPDEARFIATATMARQEAFYATALHELVHWSGAKHRLDRQMGQRFGDQGYAAEELVAELGAAFLCAELKVSAELRADHAQYLAGWLKLLKEDSRAIFTAAARASEAVTFLRAFSAPQAPQSVPGDNTIPAELLRRDTADA